ncbi:MAG: 3-phosphoshikimate 1-carboxyvinyltransferase [Cocleimonas sp.]
MSNTKFTTTPDGKLIGTLRVPGDKSMSHRSIMLGSLATGTTNVSGFLNGDDCIATMNAFRLMGVEIEEKSPTDLVINGVGMNGLKSPASDIDMGNSGTAMRLMTGLLTGQKFDSTLIGDNSLSTRPMNRITKPLTMMGANIASEEGGRPPLIIKGGGALKGIHYEMPIASAQVKSAVLLAGLYATGKTSVTEPGITRDHSERMLRGFGYDVTTSGENGNHISLQGGGSLKACDIDVPADISSAAFFMVGASIAEGSDLTLRHVGVNPTRTGVIDVLKLMGADITLSNEKEVGGEPVADIRIRSAQLKGINIPEALVPLAIDEFPVIFVAAACATGKTVLTGAEELRVKESDRIQVMADGLNNCGIDAKATSDGIIIQSGQLTSGKVDSHGDHRIAMAFAMAGLRANGKITINDCANVNTSFPDFVALASGVGLGIENNS